MDPRVLIGVVVVAAVALRPLVAWLWRRGRISDRTAAILLISRFPVFGFLVMLIGGMPLLVVALVTLPLVVVARFFYPFTRTLMADTSHERIREQRQKAQPPPS